MVCSIDLTKMIRRGGISIATVLVILLVVVVVTAVGTYLVTWYRNTFETVKAGEGVAGYISETFSGSRDAGITTVILDNGYRVDVPWDGNAVGVVALTGRYVEIEGNRYWSSISNSSGVKANNNCPWHAFLTGATLYDVKVRGRMNLVSSSGSAPVRFARSSQLESALKSLGIQFTIVSTSNGYAVEFPVYGKRYALYGVFGFYYGSTGIFGGCPQLQYHHRTTKSTFIDVATTFP